MTEDRHELMKGMSNDAVPLKTPPIFNDSKNQQAYLFGKTKSVRNRNVLYTFHIS